MPPNQALHSDRKDTLMDLQSDPPGFVPVERFALLKDDMTADEVRALLGPPASIQPPLKHKITTYLGFGTGVIQGAWKVNSAGEPPD